MLIARLTDDASALFRPGNVQEPCPVEHSTAGSVLRR